METTEKNLQEQSLAKQISTLNEPAAGFDKATSKLKESISLIQNVADSLSGEPKTKLIEAINLAIIAIEEISSKKNMRSTDLEEIKKDIDSEESHNVKEASTSQTNLPEKRIIHSQRASKASEYLKEYRENELEAVLSTIALNWNFDVFFLKDCTNSKIIHILGCYFIKKYGLNEKFRMPESIYTSFFEALEERYNDNPFHNAVHASDVLASSMYLIRNSIINYFSHSDILSTIIACLGHDVGHPGYTNRFLVANKDELATIYNDFSILEMMHCSTIFQIMKQSDTNILSTLSPDDYFRVRKEIIEMILATDMSKHFEILGKFKAKFLKSSFIAIESFDDTVDALKITIKCSDLGYAAKRKEINEKWGFLAYEEYFNQGDAEKLKNQPVSMYCDRDNTDIVKSQVGFLKYIVLPLYEAFSTCWKSSEIDSSCMVQLNANIKSWGNKSKKRNKSQTSKEYIDIYDELSKKWNPKRGLTYIANRKAKEE